MHHGADIQAHALIKVRYRCCIHSMETAFDYSSVAENHCVQLSFKVLFNGIGEFLLNTKRLLQVHHFNDETSISLRRSHCRLYLGIHILYVSNKHDKPVDADLDQLAAYF